MVTRIGAWKSKHPSKFRGDAPPYRMETYTIGNNAAWNFVVQETMTRKAYGYGRGFISKRAAQEAGRVMLREAIAKHATKVKRLQNGARTNLRVVK